MTEISDRPARRVMITGANRGVGLELTRQSAAMGDEVIACCRTPMEATALMALARKTDRISILGLDVRIERDMKPIAVGLGRRLDLLVCNAGVLSGRGGVQDPEQDSRTVEDTLMTNVGGVFFTARHFLPHLLAGSEERGDAPGKAGDRLLADGKQHPRRRQRHHVPCQQGGGDKSSPEPGGRAS
jgi:NAD(P)-dependent dehydrogenase (short-subunit alcohol dehydrogenase family)